MNTAVEASNRAPVKATWILLLIAWVMFLIPIPLTGIFIGWPLNLVAFILSIVVMAKGNTKSGIFLLLLTLIVSPFIYFFIMPLMHAAAMIIFAGMVPPVPLP